LKHTKYVKFNTHFPTVSYTYTSILRTFTLYSLSNNDDNDDNDDKLLILKN